MEKNSNIILTHKNIAFQTKNLQSSIQLTSNDNLLPMLPDNYVHNVINAILAVGGRLSLLEQKCLYDIWTALLSERHVNVFMSIPAVYKGLIEEYDKHFLSDFTLQETIKTHFRKHMRSMLSSFAILPIGVYNRWVKMVEKPIQQVYGTCETGIITHIFESTGVKNSSPNNIGIPLPGVDLRLVGKKREVIYSTKPKFNNISGSVFIEKDQNEFKKPLIYGELQVNGENVVKRRNVPDTERGLKFNKTYFRTGDYVLYEDGILKIMGKSEDDLVFIAGRSVSCMELEALISQHPSIHEVIVSGIPDHTWGQRICAICVLKPNTEFDMKDLKEFCDIYIPKYKQPSRLKIVDSLPNYLQSSVKFNKKELVMKYFYTKTN